MAESDDNVVIPKFSMHPAELGTYAIIIMGVVANFNDLLPAKYAGAVMGVWALVKVYLQLSGQQAIVHQANLTALEIRQDVDVMKSKKPTV